MTLMLLHLTSGHLHAAQTTLAWDPPVNTDGTPFTAYTGYKLYAGTASRSYNQTIDVGNVTSYTLNTLSDGSTYYFTVADHDGSGNASGYSNEVSKTFPSIYSLTATAGAGGTITTVGPGTVSTATNGMSTITSVTVTQGATQSFFITPNSGYTIASVTVDGAAVGAVSSYTFTNVTANHNLTATFSTITPVSYTLSASAGTGGSITPGGTATVNGGSSQSYSITPASGYTITDVKVDGTSVGAVASYSFTAVTANHTIAASFAVITYSLTATAGTGGSISPSGIATVNSGSNQSYAISPASGYSIADVKVDGVSIGAVASYTFFTVTASHTIAASFAVITYSVTASTGTGGSISPSGTSTVNSGSSRSYSITPATGYFIADVKVDGVSVGAVVSYSFASVTANHTITASFSIITYLVTATASTGGSITPSGIATVKSGLSQSYTIAPASGYTIADVKVDGVSVGAVSTYVFSSIIGNHIIKASFARNRKYR